MGCYITTHYIKKYPEMIDQVVFLSPAGLVKAPEDFDGWKHISNQSPFGKRCLLSLSYSLWDKSPAPGVIFKALGYYGALYLHRQWMKRIKTDNEEKR